MSDEWRNPWAPSESIVPDDDSAESSISHSAPIQPGMIVETATHSVLGGSDSVVLPDPEPEVLRPMPTAEPDPAPVAAAPASAPVVEAPVVAALVAESPVTSEISNSASFSNTVDREDFDRTVMSRASNQLWTLRSADGDSPLFAIGLVVVGRAPTVSSEFLGAQAVAISDPTKTMSKTHALFEFVSGAWYITDLDSTNGVVFIDELGNETNVTPRTRTLVTGAFLLGDLKMKITQVGN